MDPGKKNKNPKFKSQGKACTRDADSGKSNNDNQSSSNILQLTYAILEQMNIQTFNVEQHTGHSSKINLSPHQKQEMAQSTQIDKDAESNSSSSDENSEEGTVSEVESYRSEKSEDLSSTWQMSNHGNKNKTARQNSVPAKTTPSEPVPTDRDPVNLYVSNVDSAVTETEFRSIFNRYGRIVSTRILPNRGPGGVGCGFVSYDSHDATRKAKDAMNGFNLRSRQLRVDFAFRKSLGRSPSREVSRTASTSASGRNSHSGHPDQKVGRRSNLSISENSIRSNSCDSIREESQSSGNNGKSNIGTERSRKSMFEKRVRNAIGNSNSDEEDGAMQDKKEDISDQEVDEEEGDEESENPKEDVELSNIPVNREHSTTNRTSTQSSVSNCLQSSLEDNMFIDQEPLHNLAAFEREIKSVLQVDKKAVVQKLKKELDEELEKNFSGDLSERIATGLNAIEKLTQNWAFSNVYDLLKHVESFRVELECFRGRCSHRQLASLVDGAEELETDFAVYTQETDKKARIVVLLVVLEETIDKLHCPGDKKHVPIEKIDELIVEIQNAKTLFLTEEVKRRRQSRLDRNKQRLKNLHTASIGEIRTLFAKLRESIKLCYLQDPMRPSERDRVHRQLYELKASLGTFVDERDTRISILEELEELQFDIRRANVEGIGKFIATQKDSVGKRLEAETNAARRDKLRRDLSGDEFWTHIERFLIESFNGSPSESASDRDNSLNLYVNNLNQNVTKEILAREFARYGDIVSTTVSHRAEAVKFGFVRFKRPEDAVRAMEEMNGKWLNGKEVELSVATQLENTKSYWRYLLGKAIQ